MIAIAAEHKEPGRASLEEASIHTLPSPQMVDSQAAAQAIKNAAIHVEKLDQLSCVRQINGIRGRDLK